MTIKFGQNPTIRDMDKALEDRLGHTTGASKGKAPLPKPKIKPKLKKDTIGATVKWRF